MSRRFGRAGPDSSEAPAITSFTRLIATARPVGFVHCHQHAAQAHFASSRPETGRGRFETKRLTIGSIARPRIDCARAAHPGIAEKGGAAGEDLLVRGLHMRVRADHAPKPCRRENGRARSSRSWFHRGHPRKSSEVSARICVTARSSGLERILEDRLHEGARLHVDHAHFSFRGFEHDRAVPGRAVRDNLSAARGAAPYR